MIISRSYFNDNGYVLTVYCIYGVNNSQWKFMHVLFAHDPCRTGPVHFSNAPSKGGIKTKRIFRTVKLYTQAVVSCT